MYWHSKHQLFHLAYSAGKTLNKGGKYEKNRQLPDKSQ